jgi:nucleoredoxin
MEDAAVLEFVSPANWPGRGSNPVLRPNGVELTSGMISLARKTCCALLLVAGGCLWAVKAQTSPSASENPSAGLDLGETDEIKGFAAQFNHHLVTLEDDHLRPFDATALKDVKFFAFYYSASWCPPCRAFTPKLVDFYKSFKQEHPNFELIFVNHDNSAGDMLAYMKTDAMTWPAVRFEDIDHTNANKYCGEGIPDLVLVDDSGKVLSDSFQGSKYVGPDKVIDDIKSMVH